jgi:hypothetical protein
MAAYLSPLAGRGFDGRETLAVLFSGISIGSARDSTVA